MTANETHPPRPLVTTERVKGTPVIDVEGHKVGKIEEIAIDKASGQVVYAILGDGGVLGLGEHYRPIAWNDLTYDPERKAFALPMSKAQVEEITPLPTDDLSGWTAEKAAVFI